jgi:hypothetical protein
MTPGQFRQALCTDAVTGKLRCQIAASLIGGA